MRIPLPAFIHLIVFMTGIVWVSPCLAANDRSSAVILAYHRIGEDAYPDSNLRTGQFFEQVQELTNGSYTILPLPEIIRALKNAEPLPPSTVAITFEGAYRSAYVNAIPLLLEKNIPFTVFYAASHADNKDEQHMNWNELRALKKHPFVTLGILPASYTHMADVPREDILTQINKARLRHREEFAGEAKLFSYPFGEYSLHFKNIVSEQNFDAAFGLHSGSIAASSDFMALPRFTMTEIYGDLERFRLVANALPLLALDIEPADPLLTTSMPAIGFSVPPALAPNLANLSCFISGQAQPGIEVLGETRIELRLAEPLAEERTRVNCTMPGPQQMQDPNEPQNWRWFGMLLVNKEVEEDPNPLPNEPQ